MNVSFCICQVDITVLSRKSHNLSTLLMTYSAVNQTKHNPHTQGIPDHVKIMNPEAVVPLYAPTTPKPASHYHHQQHHYSTTYSPYSAQVRAYMIFLNLNFPPNIMRLFRSPPWCTTPPRRRPTTITTTTAAAALRTLRPTEAPPRRRTPTHTRPQLRSRTPLSNLSPGTKTAKGLNN